MIKQLQILVLIIVVIFNNQTICRWPICIQKITDYTNINRYIFFYIPGIIETVFNARNTRNVRNPAKFPTSIPIVA